VQRRHPPLADRGGLRETVLHRGNGLLVGIGKQRVGGRPGPLSGVPGDHVQSNPEANVALLGVGQRAHALQVRRQRRGRLAPRQVDVGMARSDAQGRVRRASEVDLGRALLPRRQRSLGPQVLALVIERLPAPRAAQDRQELVGPPVSLVLAQSVATVAPRARSRGGIVAAPACTSVRPSPCVGRYQCRAMLTQSPVFARSVISR
jgi:hypothetical protein